MLVCVELPRPRKEERFPSRRVRCCVGGVEYDARAQNLSCNGAAVVTPAAAVLPVPAEGALWLHQTGWIPAASCAGRARC